MVILEYAEEGRATQMKSFRIAVYDEKYEDAQFLKSCLESIMAEANVEIYKDGETLLEEFQKITDPYDLIFLSILTSTRNGIEIAKQVRIRDMFVPIIFVSESERFYREAYDTFAYNYLLKPLDRSRLKHILYPLMCKEAEKEEKSLTFRYRSQVHTLKLSQIMYISSSLHTVNFYMKDGTCVHCRGKLNDFTEQLKGTSFLRCHQSFFINMAKVTSMKADSFQIEENIIPISRSYAKQSQEKYKEFLVKQGKK